MKLVGFHKKGEEPKGSSIFNYTPSPEIILTREEAIEKGYDPDLKKGKGYYTVVKGIRVPITIKD